MAKTVQFLIENDPCLQEALENEYGNYSAIARLLKPRVEKFLGKKVTLQGMISSVKRARMLHRSIKKYPRAVGKSVINLRTDVAKISLEKTRRNLEKARLISADYPEAFFQVLEGTATLTVITEENIFSRVRSVFRGQELLDAKQNLAAIMIQSPEEIVKTPGCIAVFYNALSRMQINIEETVSCHTETVIVIRMEDAAKAFSVLTNLISNYRNMKNDLS